MLQEVIKEDLSDSTVTLIYYFKSIYKNKKEKEGYTCYYSDMGEWILEVYNNFKVYNFNIETKYIIQQQYDLPHNEVTEMIKLMTNYVTGIEIPTLKFRSNREVLFIL